MTPIVRRIVDQHAEQAAFLWLLRDRATDAPHYAPRHLADLEERLEAHIDGLRVAGARGFDMTLEQLARFPEAGEMFATAVLALESGDMAAVEPLIELAQAEPEAAPGLDGAIGWVAPARLRPLVRIWLDSQEGAWRRQGLVACSLHRADPGARLASFLADPALSVRARAMRLAGELGRVDLKARLQAASEDEDPAVAFWATWSSVLLGERGAALAALEPVAEADGPWRLAALQAAVRAHAPAAAMAWLRRLNGERRHARLVTTALGLLGDPAAVPWLIGRMDDPLLARAAGESVALIAGVDLALDDLEGEAPEEAPAAPGDEAADEDVDLDPDESLPWPDPERLRDWWERERGRFPAGTRHLLGRPQGPAAAAHAFAEGFQRQRRAGAYEQALASPAAPLPNWRARLRG